MKKKGFEIICPRCKGTGQIPDPNDKHEMMMTCPKCGRFGWIYKEELKKMNKTEMDWLDKELAFVTWVYKYKSFLGTLKRKDFKEFKTRQEALKKYMQEKGLKIHHLPYRYGLTLDQLEKK